jgi:hypothetical protein
MRAFVPNHWLSGQNCTWDAEFCPESLAFGTKLHLGCGILSRITGFRDKTALEMRNSVPNHWLSGHFTPPRAAFCPARCSCGTFHPCSSCVLSRKMFLWDISPLLELRFVPQDVLVGHFTPARAAFCLTRRSCGTFHPSSFCVLSRKMFLWDISPLLVLRFVPQDVLVGHFIPARAAFCLTRRSCGTFHPCSSCVLSHKTFLWDISPLLVLRFVPQDVLVGHFTPPRAAFCLTRRSFGTFHPSSCCVLSHKTFLWDISPLLELRFVP